MFLKEPGPKEQMGPKGTGPNGKGNKKNRSICAKNIRKEEKV